MISVLLEWCLCDESVGCDLPVRMQNYIDLASHSLASCCCDNCLVQPPGQCIMGLYHGWCLHITMAGGERIGKKED